MNSASITSLMRLGKKAFRCDYKKIISDNKEIGMILGKEFTEVLEKSGLLDQVREELWELHDADTKKLIEKYEAGDTSSAIDFSDFKEKHAL